MMKMEEFKKLYERKYYRNYVDYALFLYTKKIMKLQKYYLKQKIIELLELEYFI